MRKKLKNHFFMDQVILTQQNEKEKQKYKELILNDYKFRINKIIAAIKSKKEAYINYLEKPWSIETYNNINDKISEFNNEINNGIQEITNIYNEHNFVGDKLKVIFYHNGTLDTVENFDETIQVINKRINLYSLENTYKNKLDNIYFAFEESTNENYENTSEYHNWANNYGIKVQNAMRNIRSKHEYYCKNNNENKKINASYLYDSWLDEKSINKNEKQNVKKSNTQNDNLILVP